MSTVKARRGKGKRKCFSVSNGLESHTSSLMCCCLSYSGDECSTYWTSNGKRKHTQESGELQQIIMRNRSPNSLWLVLGCRERESFFIRLQSIIGFITLKLKNCFTCRTITNQNGSRIMWAGLTVRRSGVHGNLGYFHETMEIQVFSNKWSWIENISIARHDTIFKTFMDSSSVLLESCVGCFQVDKLDRPICYLHLKLYKVHLNLSVQ